MRKLMTLVLLGITVGLSGCTSVEREYEVERYTYEDYTVEHYLTDNGFGRLVGEYYAVHSDGMFRVRVAGDFNGDVCHIIYSVDGEYDSDKFVDCDEYERMYGKLDE